MFQGCQAHNLQLSETLTISDKSKYSEMSDAAHRNIHAKQCYATPISMQSHTICQLLRQDEHITPNLHAENQSKFWKATGFALVDRSSVLCHYVTVKFKADGPKETRKRLLTNAVCPWNMTNEITCACQDCAAESPKFMQLQSGTTVSPHNTRLLHNSTISNIAPNLQC